MFYEKAPFPVLKSKLNCPKPPEVFISRKNLAALILDGRKLILFSAAPGYGKTTAMADLYRRCGYSKAWLSLDSLDNDPLRFCLYLNKTLEAAGLEKELAETSNFSDCLMMILQKIEDFSEPFFLAIDDFHEITHNDILSVLRDFLEYLPTNCCIALATREDPAIPLSTHRQAERLHEFRMKELKATESETLEYLSKAGISTDAKHLQDIVKKTSGWWTCIKLFCLAWKEFPLEKRQLFCERFNGTERFIAEFLLENLFSVLDARLARAAAILAVPEFFNEDLCTLLLMNENLENPSEILKGLKQKGLLIGKEGTARYRFHALLRDYLRHQLSRYELVGVHEQVVQWLEAHNFHERAQKHSNIIKRLATSMTEKTAAPNKLFSKREIELLLALNSGLSNDEIGQQLFISTGTVKWHLSNIYDKLNAKNRTEALHKARLLGYIKTQ